MEFKKPETEYKLLLLGDQAVGKSSLMLRYTDDVFNFNIMGTAGIDLKRKKVTIEDEVIKIMIYDTAGHDRFRQIANAQYKGAKGIVIVYDVTDNKTFDSVATWMNHIKENAESGVELILVGNKIDLTNEIVIKSENGNELAQKYGVPFIETSAKTSQNVESAFSTIIKNIYAKNKSKSHDNLEIINTDKKEKKKNSKCC